MNRLPPEAHRTFYNVADALLPPAPGAVALDWAPRVEAFLARRGEASARRLLRILARLEARLGRGWRARAFSRLPRRERAAVLAAWARHPRRRADHAWLLEVLSAAAPAAASPPAAPARQSTSGA